MGTLDLVRQEIERRKMEWEALIEKGNAANPEKVKEIIYEDMNILSFLDTLSEEPDKSLEEAANEYANKHYSEWDESWDDYNGHNVEPENDKLELIDAFIAGAKWVSIYGNDIKEL